MDFRKAKGAKRDDDAPGRASQRRGRQDEDTIDASPGGSPSIGARGGRPGAPRSVQDTKFYKETSTGAKAAWTNYTAMLATQFKRMSRAEQENMITRLCQIVTIGSAMLVISLFYNFLPLFLRVFALPLVFIGAYWAGTKIVSPIMIVRYDRYLNREY